MAPKSRNWTFTLNNYTEEQHSAIMAWDMPSYILVGKEVAPTTGTPHLQGYIRFKNQVRITTLQGFFSTLNAAPHLEIAQGTFDQNYAYCTKDNNFSESGDRPSFLPAHLQGMLVPLYELRNAIEIVAPELPSTMYFVDHLDGIINQLFEISLDLSGTDMDIVCHTDGDDFDPDKVKAYLTNSLGDYFEDDTDEEFEEIVNDLYAFPPKKRFNTESK